MSRRLTGLSTIDRTRLPAECGGCMFCRVRRRCPASAVRPAMRPQVDEWSRRVLNEWGEFGRAAVEDGEVLGFIKYAPPAYLPQIRHMPSGPPEDGGRDHRMHAHRARGAARGLGGVLLREAMRDLAQRGERAAQAYATTTVTTTGVCRSSVWSSCSARLHVVRPHPTSPF